MPQGNYDHPSYLTRQAISLGASTAGANGTSGGKGFVSDMRIRKYAACVRTAGTSATSGASAILICVGTMVTGFTTGAGFTLTTSSGTNTIGTVALSSSTASTVAISTDVNTRVLAGSCVFMKNGTDATSVYDVTLEASVDPSGTWT